MKKKYHRQNIRPALKWAGGKFRLLEHILKKLPKGKRLIEPFVGSGTVFLNTDYDAYLLADVNPDLINFYQVLQKKGLEFIDYCQQYFQEQYNTQTAYYDLRHQFNTINNPLRKAALFLYLNRHAYNGLCRYNSKQQFNVPFGRYQNPYFPYNELFYLYEKSQGVIFKCQSFKKTMQIAKKGDVFYCDPPYVPLSKSANFTQYSQDKFVDADQLQLSLLAEKLRNNNHPVLISNHNTAFTRQVYQQAKLSKIRVRRFISAKSQQRDQVSELLALFD